MIKFNAYLPRIKIRPKNRKREAKDTKLTIILLVLTVISFYLIVLNK